MKSKVITPITPKTVDEYETQFKRAKSEDTLDVMYQGACDKAHRNFDGTELTRELINIERALDRCQQAFDTTQLGLNRKIDHALNKQPENTTYDPSAELSKLLSGIG